MGCRHGLLRRVLRMVCAATVVGAAHASGQAPADVLEAGSPKKTEGPHIPEPLLFDLVRPLGARKGELEANVVGLVPLRRTRNGTGQASDELGLVPLSLDTSQTEWAPEIEYAIRDGLALELEFPFEGTRLEAVKFAVQYTIGTAFEGQYIHGVQTIAERAVNSTATTWVALYLGGWRFTPHWSLLGMWGVAHETGAGAGGEGGDRTQFLQNLTLFYELTDRLHFGVETNLAVSGRAFTTLLVLPQLQYDFGRHFSLQVGLGVARSESKLLPEAAFRVIFAN